MKVNLQDVIEAIEFENDKLNHYYNKKTGVIIYKEDAETAMYNAGDMDRIDTLENWEQELVRELYDLQENPQDYIRLPERDESDELQMMMDFCRAFSDISLKDSINNETDLSRKLHKVKNVIRDKGIINDWYDYREAAEREIAEQWCINNNIEYEK